MIIISHRGYVDGPDRTLENNPDHILNLLSHNIEVEIDVWLIKNNYFLGHNDCRYKIEKEFLKQQKK